jgi:ATP-binding cassette subfamily B protein
MKIILDSVIGSQPLPGFLVYFLPDNFSMSNSAFLWVALGILVLITILSLLVNQSSWLLREYTGENITRDVRSRLFQHVQQLSLAYHDTRGISDAIYRIQWDAPAFRWLAIDGIIPLFTAIITLIAMLVVIALINAPIALIAIVISPILILLNRLYSRPLRQKWKQVKRTESSALSIIQEVLGAIRVVKAFGKEDHEHERFREESKPYIRQRIKVVFAESSFNSAVSFTTMIGTVIVLYIGTKSVLAGELTVDSYHVLSCANVYTSTNDWESDGSTAGISCQC